MGRAGADVVVVDQRLQSEYQDDATFRAVMADPVRFGYEPAAVPGTSVVLLLKGFDHTPRM